MKLVKAGPYELVAQPSDGNLVLYEGGKPGPVWALGTDNYKRSGGQAPFKLLVQDDGNLVIYDSTGLAVWWVTHTTLQHDECVVLNLALSGKLTLRHDKKDGSASREMWATLGFNKQGQPCQLACANQSGPCAWCRANRDGDRDDLKCVDWVTADVTRLVCEKRTNVGWVAPVGEVGRRNEHIKLVNGPYSLELQPGDGNLVLYKNENGQKHAYWATGPKGGGENLALLMQGDGNICVYDMDRQHNNLKWSGQSHGSNPITILQDDGAWVVKEANGKEIFRRPSL